MKLWGNMVGCLTLRSNSSRAGSACGGLPIILSARASATSHSKIVSASLKAPGMAPRTAYHQWPQTNVLSFLTSVNYRLPSCLGLAKIVNLNLRGPLMRRVAGSVLRAM